MMHDPHQGILHHVQHPLLQSMDFRCRWAWGHSRGWIRAWFHTPFSLHIHIREVHWQKWTPWVWPWLWRRAWLWALAAWAPRVHCRLESREFQSVDVRAVQLHVPKEPAVGQLLCSGSTGLPWTSPTPGPPMLRQRFCHCASVRSLRTIPRLGSGDSGLPPPPELASAVGAVAVPGWTWPCLLDTLGLDTVVVPWTGIPTDIWLVTDWTSETSETSAAHCWLETFPKPVTSDAGCWSWTCPKPVTWSANVTRWHEVVVDCFFSWSSDTKVSDWFTCCIKPCWACTTWQAWVASSLRSTMNKPRDDNCNWAGCASNGLFKTCPMQSMLARRALSSVLFSKNGVPPGTMAFYFSWPKGTTRASLLWRVPWLPNLKVTLHGLLRSWFRNEGSKLRIRLGNWLLPAAVFDAPESRMAIVPRVAKHTGASGVIGAWTCDWYGLATSCSWWLMLATPGCIEHSLKSLRMASHVLGWASTPADPGFHSRSAVT